MILPTEWEALTRKQRIEWHVVRVKIEERAAKIIGRKKLSSDQKRAKLQDMLFSLPEFVDLREQFAHSNRLHWQLLYEKTTILVKQMKNGDFNDDEISKIETQCSQMLSKIIELRDQLIRICTVFWCNWKKIEANLERNRHE